jgi:hypothetical protein
MRQIALLLSCAAVAFWYTEPAGQTFAQQKIEAVKTTAIPASQKARVKAPVVKQQESAFDQLLDGINRLLFAAPAAPPPEDPQIQGFKQEYGPRFRRLYKSELHFVRVVCQPTKPQFDKIAADGEPALQATIRKFAATWRRPVANDPSDLRTLIVEALARSVRSTLSPEQRGRYQKELDDRCAARKQVMVLNLVGRIDSILLLSAEQRVKLGEILQNNWNDSWNHEQWLSMGNRYFPPMPDDKILPLLTETQKHLWRDTAKGNLHFGFNPGLLPGIELDEEVWNAERAQKNREREHDSSKTVEKK